MRLVVVAVAVLLSVPARAEMVRDWTAYGHALVDHMALTFVCRAQIGEAPYLAARTLAADSLSRYIGQEAYVQVEALDRRFKADTQVVKLTAAECFKRKSDLVLRINVEKAKLEAD